MIENLLSWLLLPLGVMLGLAMARKRLADNNRPGSNTETRAKAGDLVKSDDDQAMIALSHAIEIGPGTVESQVALGNLFRKRGEIDRAIVLHEAALARSGLTGEESATVRYELAQDYLRAGLMDRAEAILRKLIATGARLEPALELLLDLFEQARDWPQAIDIAQRLQAVRGQSMALQIGQYHCEIAESLRHAGGVDAAIDAAEKALDVDRECVRANLLLAALAETRGDRPAAIRAYGRVAAQDRRYLPEVLAPLKNCYEEAGDAAGYAQFLEDDEADHPGDIAVTLAKAGLLRAKGENAQGYLAGHLARTPSWRGLLFWLEGVQAEDDASAKMREALQRKLEAAHRYTCSSCGLHPGVLFWQCPSCRQWATISPLPDGN